MSRSNQNIKSATIFLPYFKQGDDMNSCIVSKDNGNHDIKKSLDNHINLLQSAIDHLESIKNLIPENEEFTIYADTHYISITGNSHIIEKLHANKLVDIESDQESDQESDRESDQESDRESIEDSNQSKSKQDIEIGNIK